MRIPGRGGAAPVRLTQRCKRQRAGHSPGAALSGRGGTRARCCSLAFSPSALELGSVRRAHLSGMEPTELIGRPPRDLTAVATLMRDFPAPWCIAGGWALDLFLGQLTRAHADTDLALFREDQVHLHPHLHGWTFRKVVSGVVMEWHAGEWLSSPVHEIHARSPEDPNVTLEFLLNDRVGEQWVFRRDPAIQCPARQVIIGSAAGLPVLCPAVVLLYKAKQPRAVDELDFRAARDHLGSERREWLRAALEHMHPDHPWLNQL